MSQLTAQEQYPKFYKAPHLWIDAIEVECIKEYTTPDRTRRKGTILDYTAYRYSQIYSTIYNYAPKFKPQEGEAFIKDLEQAVSAGVGTQARRIIKSPKNIIAFDAEHQFYQCIMIIENDIKKVTSMLTDFDTAAYLDTLRKLGYYL